jgi:hypothetical protein
MDEIRARARLPHLDIEIRHRRLPEDESEELHLSVRATPSFKAASGWLAPAAWYLLALSPHLVWQRTMQAWLLGPWVAPLGLPPPPAGGTGEPEAPGPNVHPFPGSTQRER